MFVWARAFCGTRIGCPATVDCSGTIQKIHVRKIRRVQGVPRACYHDGFHDLGMFDEAPGTLQSSGSALTRNVARFPPEGLATLRVCFEKQ